MQQSSKFGDTYKSTIDATTVENGIGTFNVSFASDAWLDRHMRFEVEDATPTAYSKAFRWLGQNMTAPTLMVSNTTEELRTRYDYGRDNIVSPCAQQPISDTDKKRLSARMSTLNRIMDLQGGITTCVGVDIVQKAATDDLGLPYLYDSTTDTIADGEGVWQGIKSYSSNPSAAYHVSVIYKDANEKRSFVDAQGMITNTTCEEHGCLDKVIRD